MNTSLLCKESCSRQYYYCVFTSLLSILLILTVVQQASDQPAPASEILRNESLVVDNIISTNNSSSSGESPDSFPKIHTHMSGEKGIFVNGYLIETADGVVAIDSALTVSESKANSINKPLLAILLTHPHPDHVAGVTYLLTSSSADVPIISSVDSYF